MKKQNQSIFSLITLMVIVCLVLSSCSDLTPTFESQTERKTDQESASVSESETGFNFKEEVPVEIEQYLLISREIVEKNPVQAVDADKCCGFFRATNLMFSWIELNEEGWFEVRSPLSSMSTQLYGDYSLSGNKLILTPTGGFCTGDPSDYVFNFEFINENVLVLRKKSSSSNLSNFTLGFLGENDLVFTRWDPTSTVESIEQQNRDILKEAKYQSVGEEQSKGFFIGVSAAPTSIGLKEDGSFAWYLPPKSPVCKLTGSYTVTDNKLTLVFSEESGSGNLANCIFNFEFVNGDTLVIKEETSANSMAVLNMDLEGEDLAFTRYKPSTQS